MILLKECTKQAVATTISAVIAVGAAAMISCVTLKAGEYECPRCGEKFTPTMFEYVKAVHMFNKRKLRCPVCGNKSFCKYHFRKINE